MKNLSFILLFIAAHSLVAMENQVSTDVLLKEVTQLPDLSCFTSEVDELMLKKYQEEDLKTQKTIKTLEGLIKSEEQEYPANKKNIEELKKYKSIFDKRLHTSEFYEIKKREIIIKKFKETLENNPALKEKYHELFSKLTKENESDVIEIDNHKFYTMSYDLPITDFHRAVQYNDINNEKKPRKQAINTARELTGWDEPDNGFPRQTSYPYMKLGGGDEDFEKMRSGEQIVLEVLIADLDHKNPVSLKLNQEKKSEFEKLLQKIKDLYVNNEYKECLEAIDLLKDIVSHEKNLEEVD